jgi:hypothetical protein
MKLYIEYRIHAPGAEAAGEYRKVRLVFKED